MEANTLHNTARLAQPLEPILFPKFRIKFADFPYLHYSIGQRLFTLETCCGYGYGLGRKSNGLAWLFKDHTVHTGRRKNRDVLQEQHPYLRMNHFQGVRPSSRKENSTPGTARCCQGGLRCRARRAQSARQSPYTRLANINAIPFRHCAHTGKSAWHCPRAFAVGLGPTDPRPTAVHVEPFSTSALKVLT